MNAESLLSFNRCSASSHDRVFPDTLTLDPVTRKLSHSASAFRLRNESGAVGQRDVAMLATQVPDVQLEAKDVKDMKRVRRRVPEGGGGAAAEESVMGSYSENMFPLGQTKFFK